VLADSKHNETILFSADLSVRLRTNGTNAAFGGFAIPCSSTAEEIVRFIPTMLHGAADYIVGLITISLPFYLGLEGKPRTVLVVLGIVAIAYSLLTDYELGVVRFLRIRFHLLLDALFGIALLLMPLVFEIAADISWPLFVIGALSLILAATTEVRATGTAPVN